MKIRIDADYVGASDLRQKIDKVKHLLYAGAEGYIEVTAKEIPEEVLEHDAVEVVNRYPRTVQCQATTSDGSRCERMVELETEEEEPYCYQHGD